MRGWMIALVCCGLLSSLGAAETFPYTATVSSLNVTARSGASFGTYPTERLAKHARVEVRKAGASGWVAIRPPKDAFDWLPALAVKLSEDRKQGEIIVDSAPAYIGSTVRKIDKHVSQTDLKKGDTVFILSEKAVQQGNGKSAIWLKIAPPANEVRWVPTKHLSTHSPEQLAIDETEERLAREDRYRRENALDPPGLLANVLQGRDMAEARRDEAVERAQFLRRGKTPLTRRPREGAARPADEAVSSIEIDNGQPSAAIGTDAVGSEAVADASPRSSSGSQGKSASPPRISLDPKSLPHQDRPLTARDLGRESVGTKPLTIPTQPPVNSGTQVRPIDSEEFKKRLTQLDVDLTAMVAEDSSQWNLTSLRQRAEDLVENGPSPLERGKARLLLDRIAEFAATLPPGYEEKSLQPPVEAIATAPAAKQPDFVTQYDAVGYLMPIVGARPGLPQFQLTDKDGRSLSLVTARPGVNLNTYVKKQVGVFGQRGYSESLKKHHVLAERIVDLDVHRR